MDTNINAYEYLQALVSGAEDEEISTMTAHEFSVFLAYGSLDQDYEQN